MSKQNDIMYGRNQGLAFALDIVRNGGVEALEKEIRDRGITGISLNVSSCEIKAASWSASTHATEVAICIALVTLMDEFFFPKSQMQKFKQAFDDNVYKVTSNEDPYVVMQEYVDRVNQYAELGLIIPGGK